VGESGFFIARIIDKGKDMAFTDDDVDAAAAAAAKNAARGVKGMTIGDRRIDYESPSELLKTARMMEEDPDGAMYPVTFKPKGYF